MENSGNAEHIIKSSTQETLAIFTSTHIRSTINEICILIISSLETPNVRYGAETLHQRTEKENWVVEKKNVAANVEQLLVIFHIAPSKPLPFILEKKQSISPCSPTSGLTFCLLMSSDRFNHSSSVKQLLSE